MINEYIHKFYNINDKIIKYVENIEKEISYTFIELDKIRDFNQLKIITAMQKNRLSAADFIDATGYGYGDIVRDRIEMIYKDIFKAEDALVRTSIVSGTHAIYLMLSSNLKSGEEFIYISGKPYDTIQKTIGIIGNEEGSLIKEGIKYNYIPLKDNKIDFNLLKKSIKSETKALVIQRSIGYEMRKSIVLDEIENELKKIKSEFKDIIIMGDNCYGEFTDYIEPLEVGFDIIAGSILKNPGAGISLGGGYLVGKANLINKSANKLSAPGLGKELGLTFGTARTTLQGLYYAPIAVNNSMKTQSLFSKAYSDLGFKTNINYKEHKSDIVCAIEFKNSNILECFCKSIQKAACVDSFVIPEAWDMPGYENKIIMASGSFIDGSSIETSADGPIREPYIAYFQGSLSYIQGKLALMISLNDLYNDGMIEL